MNYYFEQSTIYKLLYKLIYNPCDTTKVKATCQDLCYVARAVSVILPEWQVQ